MSKGELNWKLWHLVAKVPEGHATICVHDYCNDPAVTMPLAFEHGVSSIKVSDGYVVVPPGYDWIDLSQHDEIDGACIGDCETFTHEEPLVAVVMCLIHVLEAKQ